MDFFGDSEDYIMHDGRKEDFAWESSVKLTLVGSEDLGMYLEEREGRKRKWQEGKMRREEMEEKEQRKMPPKKILANMDMGGSGTSSSSSHLSPGWQVNDLDLDLPGELTMNEALLSLPSLAVFKQEAPSPTGNVLSPPRRTWSGRRTDDRQMPNMVVDDREAMDGGCQQHAGMMTAHSNSPNNMQCQSMTVIMPMNGYHSPNVQDNKATGLLMCSPVSSLDGYLHSPRPESSFKDDNRFQYVLAAATSIATKQNEESLTYLNQGQPYEVKLKKLGDLAHYKGKILKSIIKICFHERRLQYMEREQIAQWHSDRPGERILEVDVPLSYGVSRVEQPAALNELHVHWDPTKDVGVYVKVNCISTEFTAKKHGGEKGVPFRIQVETMYEDRRLHTAACQIKVFKLKGADRKHKQDRERVLKRPRLELERYQPGCDATVLTTLSSDALMPPPSLVTTSPPYSPEMCISPKAATSPTSVNKPALAQCSTFNTSNQMKPLFGQEREVKASSPPCHSQGALLPDLPQPAEEENEKRGLSKEATATETQSWLSQHRFNQQMLTFSSFTGDDILTLSRDDIIQICGLADGIRLYNALHGKCIEPRLTLYVCPDGGNAYSAIYLYLCRASELLHKLRAVGRHGDGETVFLAGPNNTRVHLTDEVVRHLPYNGTYTLSREHDALLLAAQ